MLGAVRSTVKCTVSDAPIFPKVSLAYTTTEWLPSRRVNVVFSSVVVFDCPSSEYPIQDVTLSTVNVSATMLEE